MDTAADYRRRAKEAAEIADTLTDPQDRKAWMEVAVEWLRLAEVAEAQKKNRNAGAHRGD